MYVENGSSAERDLRFRCNICGERADFVVQLELVKQARGYGALRSQQMPFYLCEDHEYLYKKMQRDLELKDYFVETIKENQ
jgi:hypothetical protein